MMISEYSCQNYQFTQMASKSLCLASAGPPARRRETNHSPAAHNLKGMFFCFICSILIEHIQMKKLAQTLSYVSSQQTVLCVTVVRSLTEIILDYFLFENFEYF